jgi:histidinol-phosphate aminotransferase
MDRIRLDKNEHVGGIASAHFDEMIKLIKPSTIEAYPEVGILYNALAAWLGKPVDNILLSNGSDAAIKAIFEVYISAGDEVVMQSPTYAMYPIYAEIFGAKTVEIKYDRQLKVNIDDFIDKINSKTKLVIMANPNSPTGQIMSRADILSIIEKAAELDALVLVDEAYYWFYEHTFIDDVEKYDNLIVTRTFSKACGLASLRLGFACAHAEIIKNLYKMKPVYEVNGMAVMLGKYVIENESIIFDYVQKVKEGREFLYQAMAGLGFEPFATYSNFMVARCKNLEIIKKIVANCEKNNIIIKGNYPGTPLDDCIRITLGPLEYMKMAVEAIEEVL